MSVDRPRLAFGGDPSGPLATQLNSYVELTPLDGAPDEASEGLLIDGQGGSPPDAATLESALNSGKLLAVASPGESLSQLLLAQTGQSPGPDVPLVIYRRSNGRAGYDCTLIPSFKGAASAYSEAGPVGELAHETAAAPEIGPALVRAVRPPLGAAVGASAQDFLIPPLGAMAGYSSFSSNPTYTTGYPTINNKPDDVTVGTNTQSWTNQFQTEFYVYWVNGSPTATPYYLVILKQTGTMSLGNSLSANNSNSLGWFQNYFKLLPTAVSDLNNQPFASGFTIRHHSPKSASGDVPVGITEDMYLYARTQTGVGPAPFTAQVNNLLGLEGWAVLDQITGNSTGWEYYQSDVWNPVTSTYADFGNWWSQVYDSNNHVKAMPPTSYGSIQFEGVTVWSFAAPLFTPPSHYPYNPPPDLSVKFQGGWFQFVALLHNVAGCTGAQGSKHHHLFGWNGGWNWEWSINLASVASQQNIV